MLHRTQLPKVCVALGFSDAAQLLEHARREIAAGETFFEIRLDHLACPPQGVEVIRTLRSEHTDLSILATCRRQLPHGPNTGGHFKGSIEEQFGILMSAVEAGACAVDIEIESAELAIPALTPFRERACLIVSWHNFESTPALNGVLRRMAKVDADIWKLVTTAKKPSDVLRTLSCAKATPQKVRTILLSMGETGMPSRVLAPMFGSVYTYAAPSSADGTAPGQINAKQLHSLYRVDKLSRSSRIYGVIADPVGHSKSPAIHNRALQSKRIDAVYLPFLVAPANLRDFMKTAVDLPVAGFSVTIPHKQKIVRYLDHVDPLARRIGAVNTVWRKAGRWRGTNTDVPGVLEPLGRRLKLAKARVLVVGSGGAARGAAFALADAGAELAITGRSLDKVKALAKLTGAEAVAPAALKDRWFDALVHATPLGMHPHPEECFFEGDIPADVVFDMVYNPLETLLLRRAKEQKLDVIPGIEMFVEQAAHQFEIWTGETAPRALMEKAVLEALA